MAVPAESQEAWPELSLGMISPSCESRGGTPTGERVPQDARRIRWCGGCGPAFVGGPLPFLYWRGETGVASRETEAPPLDILFHPGFALHVTDFVKLGREGMPRERF